MTRGRSRWRAARPGTLAAVLLAAGASAEPPVQLPDGAGRPLVERRCSNCHSLDNVVRTRRTRAQWSAKVDEMISRGARIDDEDVDSIVDYLAENFGTAGDAPR